MGVRVKRWLALPLLAMFPACSMNLGSGEDRDRAAEGFLTTSPASPAAGPDGTEVVGSGNVVREVRQVTGFRRVDVGGLGELIVEQTGTESLRIEAEDNIVPLLRSDVEGGTLILGLKPGTRIRIGQPIVYRLTVKELDGLEVSGSVSAEVRGLESPSLALELSGAVDVKVAGRAQQQTVNMSGAGSYDGELLQSRRVTVDLSGTANVVVAAAEFLEVSLSGTGSVFYVGNPSVSQRVSGTGSVVKK
ncbi:MAG: GIN domain-containing protein [Actinomycetota bacterium]